MGRIAALAASAVFATGIITASAGAQTYAGARMDAWRIAFGSALAIEGGELFVGRPAETGFFPSPATHAGTVNVFAPGDAGNWVERAVISAPSGAIGEAFGAAIAVRGNRMVVGAPGQNGNRGSAYIFERSAAGAEWREVAHITDPSAREKDMIGSSVAIAGDAVMVGAPGRGNARGAVIVFTSGGGGWRVASTLQGSSGSSGDAFGAAIAVNPETNQALIGAPGPRPWLSLFGGGEPKPGAAYIFTPDNTNTWREEARLVRSANVPLGLGNAVAWSGDEALAGAPLASQFAGTIIAFRKQGNDWRETSEFGAARPQPGSGLGISLAATPSEVVAGMPLAHGVGGAIVFRRNATGTWRPVQELSGQAQFGFMGGAVAAGADVLAVGAPGADFFLGASYAYTRDANGQWQPADTVISEETNADPILGGEQRCTEGKVGPFPCQQVDVAAFLPLDSVGGDRSTVLNDLWGWTDPETGREYALVGRTNGTSFVDLTDASNPVYLGNLPLHEGANVNIWRDIKVYRDHAYIVADNAGEHGVQIFDLRQLRNVSNRPATFEETAHYAGINSAHNIVINEESGYAYVVGSSGGGETCGGGLHMVDIREPQNPKFAGCFADASTGNARTGYSHDAQCVMYRGPDEQYRGREICFGSNETALSIADVTDKAQPSAIASASYPNVAYQHQGWISDDHRYYYTNDEGDEIAGTVPRTRTIIWDIQDLDDPVVLKEHLGTTSSSDHNLYVRGNLVYESNYVSGLRILDVTDPKNPVEVGFFDTVPWGNDAPGFNGSWSNYPFFRSGNILVSSMREGLFILRYRQRPVS